MIFSLLGTCVVYTLTLAFLNNYLDIYFVVKKDIFWKIIVISVVAWMPFSVANKVKKYCFPQENDKVNEG